MNKNYTLEQLAYIIKHGEWSIDHDMWSIEGGNEAHKLFDHHPDVGDLDDDPDFGIWEVGLEDEYYICRDTGIHHNSEPENKSRAILYHDGHSWSPIQSFESVCWVYADEFLPAIKKEPSYSDRQAACGIKVGDTVRVTRAAESYEDGWGTAWNKGMDSSVGGRFKVIGIEGGFGIELNNGIRSFYYPFFVLEKVEKTLEERVADLEEMMSR